MEFHALCAILEGGGRGFCVGFGRKTHIQAQNYKAVPPFQFLRGGSYVRVYIRVLHTGQSVASLSIFVFKHIYIYDGICMVLFQKPSSLLVLLRGSDIYRKKLPVEVQMIYIYIFVFTCMKRMVYIYSVHLLGEELEQWRLVT